MNRIEIDHLTAAAISNLSKTPQGLTDEELLARYRAAKILAEAHHLPLGSILCDWFDCHIDRFEEMERAGALEAA